MTSYAVGDEAGIARYEDVSQQLTKLLYYGGKDVPAARAAQLLGLIADFEQAIIKNGPGLIKGGIGAASISNDELNDAWKINWWRTKGLPALAPGSVIPAGKYALEMYAPALNVINAGAFLAYAQPTAIERIYLLLKPVAKELAELPSGIAHGIVKAALSVPQGAAAAVHDITGMSVGTIALLALGLGAVVVVATR